MNPPPPLCQCLVRPARRVVQPGGDGCGWHPHPLHDVGGPVPAAAPAAARRRGHAEAWAHNFEPRDEHFWTVAIDLIGHGWTDKPDVQCQLPDYQKHVPSVIKALDRKKAMISGESLGGWVATWLAIHNPEAIEKIVLNTAGGWTAHPEVMARTKKLSNEAATGPNWGGYAPGSSS